MTYIIPLIIILILLFGMKNKIEVYSVFCDGVLWGLKTVMGIFPVILAVTVGIGMMRVSGLFDFLISFISPLTDFLKIPKEVMPLVLIRPFSGGGALGILTDILKEYGADTYIGVVASVIMGSCETTFYTLMVYFKNTRVKYTRHILPAAIFGDIVGVGAGVLAASIFF